MNPAQGRRGFFKTLLASTAGLGLVKNRSASAGPVRRNDGHYDIIVCGGGPGGVCAAVAAARAGKKVLLIEQYRPGGTLHAV